LIKRLVENESCDELGYSLSLPLRSHVSNTMDSSKGELSTVFEVSRKISIGGPGSPLLGDGPGLLFDPSASAKGGNCAVCISRVMHKAVSIRVAKQDVVDPD
jgi:hypothetical protein